MIVFDSDHHVEGRRYRARACADRSLAMVEYMRGGQWRPAKSVTTRAVGHLLLTGDEHPALAGSSTVRRAASAATVVMRTSR